MPSRSRPSNGDGHTYHATGDWQGFKSQCPSGHGEERKSIQGITTAAPKRGQACGKPPANESWAPGVNALANGSRLQAWSASPPHGMGRGLEEERAGGSSWHPPVGDAGWVQTCGLSPRPTGAPPQPRQQSPPCSPSACCQKSCTSPPHTRAGTRVHEHTYYVHPHMPAHPKPRETTLARSHVCAHTPPPVPTHLCAHAHGHARTRVFTPSCTHSGPAMAGGPPACAHLRVGLAGGCWGSAPFPVAMVTRKAPEDGGGMGFRGGGGPRPSLQLPRCRAQRPGAGAGGPEGSAWPGPEVLGGVQGVQRGAA